MGKGGPRGGRPAKGEGEETQLVRVAGDIGQMLSDLALVHPKKTAQILDPLIRAEIVALHQKYLPQIVAAKEEKAKHEEKLKKIREDAEKLANATDPPKDPKK